VKPPRPLSDWNPKRISAVFTDLDGTLTEGQQLPSAVIAALERLNRAKIAVILVSGRPAGWADCLTRLLPFDAVTFEN